MDQKSSPNLVQEVHRKNFLPRGLNGQIKAEQNEMAGFIGSPSHREVERTRIESNGLTTPDYEKKF